MNQNPNNAFLAGLAFALVCILLFAVLFLVLWILFCLTLQRTQTEVRPRNRTLAPGLVWLHLLHLGQVIPLVGYLIGLAASIWDLIMVLKLGRSLKNEFEDRRWHTDGEGFGRVVGVIWCVCQLVMYPIGIAMNFVGPQVADPAIAVAIVVIFGALWLTGIICWIIYWVQMASYGRRLREGAYGYRRGSVEEDYDDEYRPRQRRYDDNDDDEYERDRDADDRGGFDFDRGKSRRDDEYDDDQPRRRGRDDY